MSEDRHEMFPLPIESLYALRQLLKNAIDAIDQQLIQDAGDVGLVSYAIKSIVAGSSNVSPHDSDMLHGACQCFDNGELLDIEEESARPLMSELFGFRWAPHSNAHCELGNVRRIDGKKFIEQCQRFATH